MSLWSKLGNILKVGGGVAAAPFTGGASLIPTIASMGGSVLGGLAEGKAAGRSNQVQAGLTEEEINQGRQQQFFNNSLAREADKRASGANAMRAIQQSEYLANAEGYAPKAGLGSFGFGPKGATAAEKAAAAKYLAENQQRINTGDSLLPQVKDPGTYRIDPKLLKAGKLENVMGALGGGLEAFGNLSTASQQRTYLASLIKSGVKLTPEERQAALTLGLPADISGGKNNV